MSSGTPSGDYPNPILRPPRLHDVGARAQFGPTPTTPPFFQTDWPNPPLGVARRWADVLSSPNFTAPSTAAVFRQSIWPNPPLGPYRRFGEVVSSRNFTAVSTAAPFAQSIWPNPRFVGRPVHDGTVGRNALTASIAPPFHQSVWINPRLTPRFAHDAGVNPRIGQDAPFAQRLWPNPRPRPWPIFDIRALSPTAPIPVGDVGTSAGLVVVATGASAGAVGVFVGKIDYVGLAEIDLAVSVTGGFAVDASRLLIESGGNTGWTGASAARTV